MRKRFIVLAVLVIVIPAYAVSEYPYNTDKGLYFGTHDVYEDAYTNPAMFHLYADKFFYRSDEPVTIVLENLGPNSALYWHTPNRFIQITSFFDLDSLLYRITNQYYEEMTRTVSFDFLVGEKEMIYFNSLSSGIYMMESEHTPLRIFIVVI